MLEPAWLRPDDNLGATRALVWWAIVGVVVPLGAAAWFWLISRRLAGRAAHERHDGDARQRRLVAGDAVIIGVVEDDGAEGPALRVAIEQAAREWVQKGRRFHSWTERARHVRVRPFWVRCGNGERVRVDADARVFLVDRLDGVERLPDGARARTATLVAGEPVYIVGRLRRGLDATAGAAYRDGAEGWLLAPPAIGRMLVSTEPLGARFLKRARVHRGLALAALLVAVGMHLACLLAFDDLLVFGARVQAQLDGTRTWQTYRRTRHSGYWVRHYEAQVHVGDDSYHAEISARAYDELARRRRVADGAGKPVGLTLPMVVTPHHAVAGELNLDPGLIMISLLIDVIFGIVAVGGLTATRPWYERGRIVDRGAGELALDTVSIR